MYTIFVIIMTAIIVLCTIGIAAAIKVQNKQKKKYDDCVKAINEREDETYNYDGALTPGQIKRKDKTVNVEELQKRLYDKFLTLQEKINNLDNSFDGLLTGFIKQVYNDKINLYKNSNTQEKIENINLLGYSITEFSKKELKFRIKITAINYKTRNDEIISGSNTNYLEQIYIVTYDKIGKVWKISNIEKVLDKKMEQ